MKKSYKNKWQIFRENNPTAFICVMIILVNLVFIILSTVLIAVIPENRAEHFSLSELLQFAFTIMVNPSGKYTYGESTASRILTTVVVLLGMISLTGGTVGFITSIINGIIEKTAANKRYLKLKNHIVILNYNHKVPSIITDYCFDDMKNTYVVILSTEDKEKILHDIDNMYDNMGMKKRFKNIIVRNGNPMSKLDLEKIALKDAKTVVIANPGFDLSAGYEDKEDRSFEVSKLFMFVTWYFSTIGDESTTNIVVESGNSNMEKMVKDYHLEENSHSAVPVNYNEIMGKMIATTSLMPYVNGVMQQMFSFEGVEIYIEDKPKNLSIIDEIKESNSVIPIFDQGDKRVYIAEAEEELGAKSGDFKLEKALPKKKFEPKVDFEKDEIIIVGTNSKLGFMLESLSCFKVEYENNDMHVILAGTKDEEEELKAYYANEEYKKILVPEKYNYVIIDNLYDPMVDLEKVVSKETDTIIFLSDDKVSDSHIDEKPLIYWSNLKSQINEKAKTDLIVEILDSQNQSIVEGRNKDQIIVSDDFLGHLYAQLGKTPERIDVIKDMITSEGDSSSVTMDQEAQNAGDLICTSVKNFFKDVKDDLVFKTKKELIVWTYEATDGQALVVGVVKEGVPYLFSRTDGNKDGLDSAILLGINEGQIYDAKATEIKLNPEDELIVFM